MSRSSRTCASSGGLAHHGVHRVSQPDHVGHPAALLRRGEVAADARADVSARADVEHPAVAVLEDVDAGGVGERLGEEPLAPQRGADSRRVAGELLERVDAEVADALDETVQHVNRGTRVVEGAVVRVVVEANTWASDESLWFGDSSLVTSWRASVSVSRTSNPGHGVPVRRAADLRKLMSKPALWATRTLPAANSRNAGKADSMRGASSTMASVMPVSTEMKAGIGSAGLTRVWNSPSTSPPRTLTAPISVMPHSAGAPPVDSRSTTTKVTSMRRVPRSSNVAWIACMGRPYAAGLTLPRRRGGRWAQLRVRARAGREALRHVGRAVSVVAHSVLLDSSQRRRRVEPVMLIDCQTCPVRDVHCADCMVTALATSLWPAPEPRTRGSLPLGPRRTPGGVRCADRRTRSTRRGGPARPARARARLVAEANAARALRSDGADRRRPPRTDRGSPAPRMGLIPVSAPQLWSEPCSRLTPVQRLRMARRRVPWPGVAPPAQTPGWLQPSSSPSSPSDVRTASAHGRDVARCASVSTSTAPT